LVAARHLRESDDCLQVRPGESADGSPIIADMFGYRPTIYQPKVRICPSLQGEIRTDSLCSSYIRHPFKQPGNKDIYKRLLKQCQNLHIPTLSSAEEFTSHYSSSTDLILDTIFGFSFHPPVRSPFDAVLRTIADKRVPIVSIDIPSGWSVEDGAQKLHDEQGGDVPTFEPEVLLSLTCPKVGVKEFKGRHFLGGRFIPE
jgi:hypothetical protein